LKQFTDTPYCIAGLESIAKNMDANVFNLLCDWEDLEGEA